MATKNDPAQKIVQDMVVAGAKTAVTIYVPILINQVKGLIDKYRKS